jgi:hypothetical protein
MSALRQAQVEALLGKIALQEQARYLPWCAVVSYQMLQQQHAACRPYQTWFNQKALPVPAWVRHVSDIVDMQDGVLYSL